MLFLQNQLCNSRLKLHFLLSSAPLQMRLENLIVLRQPVIPGVVGEEGHVYRLVQRDDSFYVGVDLCGVG